MNRVSAEFASRGAAIVWQRRECALGIWPSGHCRITASEIIVRAFGSANVHTPSDLIELRRVRYPYGRFIAISGEDGVFRYSSFGILRSVRLRAAVTAFGYAFTEELRRLSLVRREDDMQRYGLMDITVE